MKQKILILLLILASICVCVSYYAYQYYAPPILREPTSYIIKDCHNHDTLRIAFIGDSWVFFHSEHNCVIPPLLKDLTLRPIAVYSLGICGLTSKEIYENINNDSNYRGFFQQRKYDYCIVSAGINDTYKKMSTSYYKISMHGIIKFLLTNNIHPIILEIPDYNIQKAYINQKIEKKLLRNLSMFVNSTSIDCKQEYRNTLDKLIKENKYQDKVSILRYKSWNNNYNHDIKLLYRSDEMHLNENGYIALDSVIYTIISKDYNNHSIKQTI